MWRIALDQPTDATALIAADEAAQAGRMLNAAHGEQWLRARGTLRELLGGYGAGDPAALVFAVGAEGKPRLPGSELEFNLAHSGALALIAVARGFAVGVDVELGRRAVDELVIARRVLGAAVAAELEATPEGAARTAAFLRAWARHEAAVKCRGTTLAGHDQAALLDGLWLRELEIDGGAGAVTAAREPDTLVLLRRS